METFRTAIFKSTYLPKNINWLLLSKVATGSCSGKKKGVLRCTFLWEVEVFRMLCWKHRHTGKIMNLFLASEHMDSLEKEPVLVSAKLTWKKGLSKEHIPAAAFVCYNKSCIFWYAKNMNKIKISINFYTSLIFPLISPCTILWMRPKTQSRNA